MLSRIPAVKWAFKRLRPPPPGGSIAAAPSAADEQPAIIAEAAPALDSLNIEPMPGDAGIEVAVPVEDNTAVSVIEETASAATTNIGVSDHTSPETPVEVEFVVVEQTSGPSVEVASEPVDLLELISSDPPAERLTEAESEVVNEAPASLVEVDAIDAPEPVVSSDLAVELLTDGEPDIVDEAPVFSVDVEAIEAAEPIIGSDASTERPEDVEPVAVEHVATAETELKPVESSGRLVEEEPACALSNAVEAVTVDEASVIVVDAGITVPASAEASVDSEPASSVAAAEIEPDAPDDLPPGPAIAAEDVSTDTPVGAAQVEPAPAPKTQSAPKVRAKIVEPADRATLIRQRWSETGIRMWNPRLHGTGEATLNIQGRIELLPPEPGETMPRYDKLEFKLLGGQIVCEGVIVEAPADASQRSFTRLAEPRGADRTREPVRERQAALA
ncbi:hypothetical protein GCM10010987_00570 [Bradyrhizobium guangdongense]|uniref:Uncharacterized protein n=1 Tax=Bradyrhizobium guangdongense TaxID=1325090 RepID=A0AA87W0B5_9BRAD|nr:hypothetical protein [Bradyrhizobium guangdongense]GGI18691.1 hypothetical protein GCM10010987_00570 [Bradyrhizobium guangdongense]